MKKGIILTVLVAASILALVAAFQLGREAAVALVDATLVPTVAVAVNPAADTAQPETTLVATSLLPTQTAVRATDPPAFTPTPGLFAGRIPIIEYHYSSFRLNDQVMMTAEWYQAQMKWLADSGFKTLTAEELVAFIDGERFPVNSVALSFDLGTAERSDFADVIIPALRKYKLHAIFFLLVNENVITDACGVANRYCWDDLKKWQDEGLISVESHGLHHPDYKDLNAADMRYDAGEAKRLIEQNLGTTVVLFAYPFDSVNKTAMSVVEGLGYQAGVGGYSRADRSAHQNDDMRYNLPRVYPYSNPKIYPVINGANGQTFDELIFASVEGTTQVAMAPSRTPTSAPTHTATPAPTSSPTRTATLAPTRTATTKPTATPTRTPLPTSTLTVQQTYDRLVSFCRRTPTDSVEWLNSLNAMAFAPDLSAKARLDLPADFMVRPTCNFESGNQPRAVVLHYTGTGTSDGAIAEFQERKNTSAHYIIARDGTVIQMVPETFAAYHASCYGSRSMCLPTCPICDGQDGRFKEPYQQSIGIELVNEGHVQVPGFKGDVFEDYLSSYNYRYWEDYTPAQLEALRVLVQDIRQRWSIPWEMVIGHYRVNSRPDPGPALNLFWDRYGSVPAGPIFDVTLP